MIYYLFFQKKLSLQEHPLPDIKDGSNDPTNGKINDKILPSFCSLIDL